MGYGLLFAKLHGFNQKQNFLISFVLHLNRMARTIMVG